MPLSVEDYNILFLHSYNILQHVSSFLFPLPHAYDLFIGPPEFRRRSPCNKALMAPVKPKEELMLGARILRLRPEGREAHKHTQVQTVQCTCKSKTNKQGLTIGIASPRTKIFIVTSAYSHCTFLFDVLLFIYFYSYQSDEVRSSCRNLLVF